MVRAAGLPHHPAVNKTLQLLPGRIQEGTVRLRDISRAVDLSESRFMHLFSAQVGMAFRPYVRCLRVTYAVGLTVQGLSLTEAAHEAGFADSSHLNRACHLTPGMAPNVSTSQFHITLRSRFVQAGIESHR
ncbi:helix-turn-helix domain-containing protein [Nocardia sp. NPDC004604]|uniref:helix-turn-helix domain-containing protein n=1 Tax=Nocardia sp. NPDC004604 TaxID=3157013 RepID=UPI0033A496E6